MSLHERKQHCKILEQIGLSIVRSDYYTKCAKNRVLKKDMTVDEIELEDPITLNPLRQEDVVWADGYCMSQSGLKNWVERFKTSTTRPTNPITKRTFEWSEVEKLGLQKENFLSYLQKIKCMDGLINCLAPGLRHRFWKENPHNLTKLFDDNFHVRGEQSFRVNGGGPKYRGTWAYRIDFLIGYNSIVRIHDIYFSKDSEIADIIGEVVWLDNLIRETHGRGCIIIQAPKGYLPQFYNGLRAINKKSRLGLTRTVSYPVNQDMVVRK